uniref:Uncharacterized protein n=1 Tax=Arundo donax TaxID=35708 RepID=A0A0A8ZYL6_ARUDO
MTTHMDDYVLYAIPSLNRYSSSLLSNRSILPLNCLLDN